MTVIDSVVPALCDPPTLMSKHSKRWKLLLSPFTEKIEIQRILLPVRGWRAVENMEAAEGGQLWVLVKTVESTFQSQACLTSLPGERLHSGKHIGVLGLGTPPGTLRTASPSCQKFSRVLNHLYLIWTLL